MQFTHCKKVPLEKKLTTSQRFTSFLVSVNFSNRSLLGWGVGNGTLLCFCFQNTQVVVEALQNSSLEGSQALHSGCDWEYVPVFESVFAEQT